ncbi:amphi-Trp domain-containing protein [Streptomyces bicolor]|uniref:amphi-Trp domain-containing protein n=1 Tax=Streptomyces bicolor TaxID=66874 RepID=UPI0004E1ED71|nr:amphi-Trp domain-containing protein [Streptomyces bicolor]
MKDLKLEQKRSLSRLEAADQLEALAAALRQGGEAELELDPWKLSLRIPAELRGEIEVEVSDGEIELEIEFKWPTAPTARTASSQATTGGAKAGGGQRKSAAAGPRRSGAAGARTSKRATAKSS